MVTPSLSPRILPPQCAQELSEFFGQETAAEFTNWILHYVEELAQTPPQAMDTAPAQSPFAGAPAAQAPFGAPAPAAFQPPPPQSNNPFGVGSVFAPKEARLPIYSSPFPITVPSLFLSTS